MFHNVPKWGGVNGYLHPTRTCVLSNVHDTHTQPGLLFAFLSRAAGALGQPWTYQLERLESEPQA